MLWWYPSYSSFSYLSCVCLHWAEGAWVSLLIRIITWRYGMHCSPSGKFGTDPGRPLMCHKIMKKAIDLFCVCGTEQRRCKDKEKMRTKNIGCWAVVIHPHNWGLLWDADTRSTIFFRIFAQYTLKTKSTAAKLQHPSPLSIASPCVHAFMFMFVFQRYLPPTPTTCAFPARRWLASVCPELSPSTSANCS